MTVEMVKAQGEKAEGRRCRARQPYSKLPEATRDQEARRLCAVVLEVLGGARTPTDAAGALGVSVPRYYAIEAKALRGLLGACERRPRGRRRTAESETARLRSSLEQLTRERDRLQALLRASQRAMGLPPARPENKRPGKKRKERRAQVRALRASRSLKEAQGEKALEGKEAGREDPAEVKS